MEDAVRMSDSFLKRALSEVAADLDVMDEMLLCGDWLDSGDCSDLMQPVTSNSGNPFSSSGFSPPFELSNSCSLEALPDNDNPNDSELPDFSANLPSKETLMVNLDRGQASSLDVICENPGQAMRLWMEPTSSFSSLKDRLVHALRCIKDSHRDGDVLVQVWVPVRRGQRQVLITSGQPYSLDPNSQRLVSYRSVSTNFYFSAEENSDEALGLPGRVFVGKVPEWTPDVRYFSSHEYPRVIHAQHYDVRGTIGLPIFERNSQNCIGVVEVVMTNQKINYSSDLETICNALQAVDLRSSEVLSVPNRVTNDSLLTDLPEIREVLRAVCEAHRLPLAQTWIPCMQQGKRGSRHSAENYKYCLSTVDDACYLNDPSMWSFHVACSEYHLLKGEGVVGKAFATNQPCFSANISSFSKTEYPLSHHAKMFNLRAAVAIRLRSILTGTADFVLEFFLPLNCIENEDHKLLLNALSTTIQQVCQSLRVLTTKELEDESVSLVNERIQSDFILENSFSEGQRLQSEKILSIEGLTSCLSRKECSWVPSITEAHQKGESNVLPTGIPLEAEKQENEGFCVSSYWDNGAQLVPAGSVLPEVKQLDRDSIKVPSITEAHRKGESNVLQTGIPLEAEKQESEGFCVSSYWDNGAQLVPAGSVLPEVKQLDRDSIKVASSRRDCFTGEYDSTCAGKTSEKRPTKTEKTISLQVLRQHFAGSLKDAAKSLGVCPTTLKRICRQHGIARWPSRKIKKVGHSLKKLQVVIDSVQGAEGAFQLSSLYENFTRASGADNFLPGSHSFSRLKQKDDPESSNGDKTEVKVSFHATASTSLSSSCSQSSSSSLGYANEAKQATHAAQPVIKQEASMDGDQSGMLRRAPDKVDFELLTQEVPTSLTNSEAYKILNEHHYSGSKSPPLCGKGGLLRVKCIFGEEKIRFRLQPTWGFEELKQEVATRFNIIHTNSIDLKYLDDDSEWVLMTCDEDLQECIEVHKSSDVHTIRLVVHSREPSSRVTLYRTGLS